MSEPSKTRPTGGERHLGPARTSPYPVSRLAPAFDLVDMAKEIAQADDMIAATATAKLQVIVEQVRALQAQARAVLEESRRNRDLHRVPCGFQRIPGRTYHLYRREDGTEVFSLLSPSDWRGHPPYAFIGSFRLEADRSWTPMDGAQQSDDDVDDVVKALFAIEDRGQGL